MLRIHGRKDLEATVAAICEGGGAALVNQGLAVRGESKKTVF